MFGFHCYVVSLGASKISDKDNGSFGGRRGILNIVLENLRNIEYLPEKRTEYGIFQ